MKKLQIDDNEFIIGKFHEYKGVTGLIVLKDGITYGMLDIQNTSITWIGSTVATLYEGFIEMVDKYLDVR